MFFLSVCLNAVFSTAGQLQNFIHPIHNGSSTLQSPKSDLDEAGLITTEGVVSVTRQNWNQLRWEHCACCQSWVLPCRSAGWNSLAVPGHTGCDPSAAPQGCWGSLGSATAQPKISQLRYTNKLPGKASPCICSQLTVPGQQVGRLLKTPRLGCSRWSSWRVLCPSLRFGPVCTAERRKERP